MWFAWFDLLRDAVMHGDASLGHALLAATALPLAAVIVRTPAGDLNADEVVDYATLMVDLGQKHNAEALLSALATSTAAAR